MGWRPEKLWVTTTTQASTYTFALADAGTVVESTSATAVNFTVPTNASVPFPIGTVIELCQYGAGQVTLVPGSLVTLNSPAGLKTRAQFSTLAIRKRGTSEWQVTGDTTT